MLLGGGVEHHWIPDVLVHLNPVYLPQPAIEAVPAIRRVGGVGEADEPWSGGKDIIKHLAELEAPDHHSFDRDRERFDRINEFLRTVTGNPKCELRIPYKRDTIQVHMNDKVLPIESLGTGVHEVILLAAAATIASEQVLCIEEPEIHLHPILQKKLLSYLEQHTDNQYFIATHSAHFLDIPGVSVFHVTNEDGQSLVRPALTPADKSEICADLGYRASDIMQANCVIWVEGPSDRIYLNHWIRAISTELIEGIHYSIMFYGGRLLRHLTADDPEVDEFISLRRLNRYVAVVMDSDREKVRGRLNKTKQRIRKELQRQPGFVWVTAGREIENYVPPDVLERAVKEAHPKAIRLRKKGQYDNCLAKVVGLRGDADKIKVATAVTQQAVDLSVLDLKAQVSHLVRFVCEANDFSRL